MVDTVLGADTFVEDGTNINLDLHTPTGPNAASGWTKHTSHATVLRVTAATDVVEYSSTPGTGIYYIDDVPPSSSQYAEVDITIGSGSATQGGGVVLRINTTESTFYWIRIDPAEDSLQFYRWDAGSLTLIDTIAYAVATSDVFRLRLEVEDVGGNPTFTCSVDGTPQTWDTAAATTVADTSGSKITATGRIGLTLQSSSSVSLDNFEAGTTGTPDAVSMTNEPADNRVLPRAADGNGDYTLSGTYSGSGTPTAIQYRLVADGTTTAVSGHDWQTLDASPSAGTWSGTIADIPAGGPYNVDVRWSNDTGVTDEGSNGWGVGAIIGVIGQSQARNFFDIGSDTPGEVVSAYAGTWSVPATTGAVALGDTVGAVIGVPVGLLDYGIGSTALLQEADTGSGYWLDTSASSVYDAFQAAANTVGAVDAIVWLQGEADALSGTVTAAEYQAGLGTLRTNIAADITPANGQSSIPFIIVQTGRDTRAAGAGSDQGYTDIRTAQAAYVAANSDARLTVAVDIELSGDQIHYSAAGYTVAGTRAAQATLDAWGETSIYPHPTISLAEAVDSGNTTITIVHGDGTDFTPAGAGNITGFRVLDDGTPVGNVSASRATATTIAIAHDAVSGARSVDYMWGRQPTITGAVLDNTSLTLPLVPNDSIAEASTIAPLAARHLMSMRSRR